MTDDDLKRLLPGDLVRNKVRGSLAFVVTENHGDTVTAVRTVLLTNPIEWDVVQRLSDAERQRIEESRL